MDEGHVVRQFEFVCGVPAGLIQDHRRVHIRIERPAKRLHKNSHVRGVDVWHQPLVRAASLRAHGGVKINPFVVGLPHCADAFAPVAPHARGRAVLAEAGFVLSPNFKPFAGMLCANLLKPGGQFF